MTEENKVPSGETAEDVVTEETSEAVDTAAEAEDTQNGGSEETQQEQTEAAGEEAPEDSKESKDRKFFGKKKEKKDKKDEKIEELTDQVKRQMAEFDNYRKRTEKEKASMYIIGAKDIVEKILPVVDNFERGLATAAGSEDPFVQGMEKIYKQLLTTLGEVGVKPIEAVGKEFNPDFHNAVMHVEDEEVGENIIVEEFQKGYLYKDFVVRHSMVKVAN
ncbi:MAG: nucleotide exchange factor GrpE [Oliverpabstia sp.]